MTTEAEDFVASEDSYSEVSSSEKEDSFLTLFLDILRLPEISSSMHGTLTNISAIHSKLSSFLSSHSESSTSLPPEPSAMAAGERKVEPLRMTAAAFYIPKERETGGEVDRLGEDAFFLCEEKQVVGVADGVGSWKKVGMDAGAYARELMSKAEEAARREEKTYVDPIAVLEVAHKGTTADGSSTACIVALHDKIVSCANIGAELDEEGAVDEVGDFTEGDVGVPEVKVGGGREEASEAVAEEGGGDGLPDGEEGQDAVKEVVGEGGEPVIEALALTVAVRLFSLGGGWKDVFAMGERR